VEVNLQDYGEISMNISRIRLTKKVTKEAINLSPSVDNLVPASNGDSMNPFIEWIKNKSSLRPKNIFEIGANMAQDAEALKIGFGLKDKDVWVFEPHPQLFEYILKSFRFNAYDSAVLDKDGSIYINIIDIAKNSNTGISSVRQHNNVPKSDFKKVSVVAIRMDTFMKTHKIKTIDFLKLDVEGCNYEVLKGFGKKIASIKAIHIESEHKESWKDEKLWDDIKALLEPYFELVYFQRHFTQSDSFWVQPQFLKNEPK
jgi:FkbM family methyltransferase